MKCIAIAVAGLLAGAPLATVPAQARTALRPESSHSVPLQPPGGDPRAEVQDLQQKVAELHARWDTMPPAERSQRLAQLQQELPTVQNDVQRLPPDQKPEVQAMLTMTALQLADILRKSWPT